MEFSRGVLLGLVLLAFAQDGLAMPKAVTKADDKDYRLPKDVEPVRYVVELTVGDDFATSKKFQGSVAVTVKPKTTTKTIVMHAANLTIEPSAEYNITKDEDVEKITLTLAKEIVGGQERIINFKYTGILHEDMYGFYLSYYTDEGSNKTEYIATTQFQATYARRAFPCFDEPAFKAKFQITINRPAAYNTMSNTKLASTSGNKDVYEETPEMSTYLVAFIVSKFKGYGAVKENVVKAQYDVFCRENALDTAKYAYEIGPKILDALSSYAGIEYYKAGIDKMYQVAIPDFAAGAMENWGLVTYRETALLWDENESTANYKQRVATVIAHEFAHMWFGDLVTLEWWSYTWLNEGFARYLQYFVTKEVETDWELEKQFVIEQQQSIFVSDAVTSAFALSSDAQSPTDISNKFASISYNKGASIIRMMNSIMGEDKFKTGIREYLATHNGSNTNPAHLWSALSNHIDAKILPENLGFADVMGNWTTQAGFPVITVKKNGADVILTQERFLYDTTQRSDLRWNVPITYTTSLEPNFKSTEIQWLLETDNSLTIPNILHNETGFFGGWVIVNLQQNGYYRVNYDDELWKEIEDALKAKHTDIDVLNRAQIVDDLFNLARANIVKYQKTLDITSYLKNETDYYPWYAAFSGFSYIRKRRGESEYLQEHIQKTMTELYNSVSFQITTTTSHIDILKTSLALDWACTLGVKSCVDEADKLFKQFKSDERTPINPNIRSTVYCSALRQSSGATGKENWDFLWEVYTNTTLATEQNIILSALGCTKDEDILTDYLTKSITEGSGIRKQDARSVFTAVLSGNLNGVNVGFKFFKANIGKMSSYYGGMNDLSSIITGIADRFTTQQQIDEFAAFAEEHKDELKEAVNQIESALESARANLKWAQSDLDSWLSDAYGSASSITASVSVLIVVFVSLVYNSM